MKEKRFKPLKRISLEDAEKYVSAEEDFTNSFVCFYALEPSEDPKYPNNEGWEKITYYTARSSKPIRSDGIGEEIIYVMSNISYPGLFKIGFTDRPVHLRRKELSTASGVPTPFKVEYIFKVPGRGKKLEGEIHTYLNHKRVSAYDPEFTWRDREFFDISLSEAIEAVKKIGEKYI